MNASETPSEAYDRGTVAGKIDARLAGHDKHFARINGSLERIANEMHELRLAMQALAAQTNARDQRLEDQAISRDATVLTTAAALKDAETARRDKSESNWTPLARVAVAVSAIAAVIGIVLAVYANIGH